MPPFARAILRSEVTPLVLERFWSRVDKGDGSGCWNWTAAKDRGYGRFSLGAGRASVRAHRVSYVLAYGDLAEGYDALDHECRNPSCVRPDHLSLVTHAENIRRGFSPPAVHGRRTHCVNGHPFSDENTWRHGPDNGRYRRCRVCQTQRAKAARIVKRSARIREALQSGSATTLRLSVPLDVRISWANNVRAARLSAGMTQVALNNRAGLGRDGISRVECGAGAAIGVQIKVSKALGLAPSVLFPLPYPNERAVA